MLRRYLKTLFLITIASLLFLGDFAIELLAPDVGRFVEQDPRMKLLVWGVLFFCLVAAVFLFVREHNKPASNGEGTGGAIFATEADQVNRRAMLGLVRHYWIEGVLHRSIWNEAQLILNFERRSEAVARPCNLALRRAGQPDSYVRPGTSVLEIYRQEQKELVLLGEPGSGKTTLLLEIAEALIREAENDQSFPIPVVFHLSAWREKHVRLDAWMVEQLNRDYGIPTKIGRRWVDGGALLLLLDGLDEVAESRRAACVGAINEYRLKHQNVLRPMVVCCRTREYDEIPNLRLNAAIVIQPLTRPQIDDYLKGGGKALASLRAILREEPALYQSLFTTPLMLHVAVTTYEGQSAADLRRSAKPEERRRRLWDAYIERMFERKQEEEARYEKAQALDWLAWLGNYLTCKDLQKYLIEGMQPNDLPRPWQSFLVRWLLSLLLAGLSYMRTLPGEYAGQIIVALIGIWFGYSRNIQSQPIRNYSIGNLRRRWKSNLIRVTFGAVVGAACGAAFFMVLGAAVGAAFFASMAFGAVLGVVTAVPNNLVLIKVRALDDTVRPNQGIHISLRTAVFAAVSLVVLMVPGFMVLAAAPPGEAAIAAAGPATLMAVLYGGRSTFQHYLLRLLLWRSGRFPRNITMFLDWAAQRVIVQRVGGGWRFVHRMLQERFAELYDEKHPDERRNSPLVEN